MPFTADLVSEIDQHIHETLYIFDPSLHFFPVLAAALPEISADGKQYTIKLRTDARFHDGSTMTADDVVTSLQRWIRLSPRGRSIADFVDSIGASSSSRVVMTLKRPYAPMLALLAYPNGAAAIMPKRLATAPDPLKEFIGTGPYKFDRVQARSVHQIGQGAGLCVATRPGQRLCRPAAGADRRAAICSGP